MITINQAGLALLQDGGRDGYQGSGVAISGAWDQEQYHVIGALLGEGNPSVFEVLGGDFSFYTDKPIDLALTGFLTSNAGALNQVMQVAPGKISVRAERTSYVAIRGLRAQTTLGSVATDTVSGLGPERITSGMTFEVGECKSEHRISRTEIAVKKVVRFVAGPHAILPATSAAVTATSRSGVRISGGGIASNLTLASLPITPGTIQDTGSELIIVGPDGGVSGGYPVVGVVVAADLPLMARFQAGDLIHLKPVGIHEVPKPGTPTVVNASAL